jgi:hypothetical protein
VESGGNGSVYSVPYKSYFGHKFEYDPKNNITQTSGRKDKERRKWIKQK